MIFHPGIAADHVPIERCQGATGPSSKGVATMRKIDRKALAQAHIAGGSTKTVTANFPYNDNTPATNTATATGSMTSSITVNGKTVMNQTVTF
jgi:hypothetical protein